jgi:hypothetical protein
MLGTWALIISATVSDARAVDLWYDFERDSGRVATDKLIGDGAQYGGLLGNVSLGANPPRDVPFGFRAALFDVPNPVPPYSTIEIPDSTTLGGQFTLAMHANNLEKVLDFTRLFSSYGGTGGVGTDRLLFDYDPSGGILPNGFRAIVNSMVVEPAAIPAGISDPGYHHYALSVDGGLVTIYFDGAQVATGDVGVGYSNVGANLHVGEDPHDLGGTANEQFVGNVDDVLVVNQALTAGQIASLASGATAQSLLSPGGTYAVNYDFEGDSGVTITDKFTLDGQQNGITHVYADVDRNAGHAKQGAGSGRLIAPNAFSQIDTGVSGTDLGASFTLSTVVNVDADGYSSETLTRLFSTYSGGGPAAGRLVMDFEPDASSNDIALRLLLPDGTEVTTNIPFSYGENHTLTATYDMFEVKLYIDGVEVASGFSFNTVDLGEYTLMVGEDLGGIVNEQFLGDMDDVLILSRALSAQEVAQLAAGGAAALFGVEPEIPGDANLDGHVNDADASILGRHWQQPSDATWADGDFNGDGKVSDGDAAILAAHWGQGAEQNDVPEPGVLGLIASAALAALMGHRRR